MSRPWPWRRLAAGLFLLALASPLRAQAPDSVLTRDERLD